MEEDPLVKRYPLLLCLLVGIFGTLPGHGQDPSDFSPGTRVEIDGTFRDGVLTAVKLIQEEPDEFIEVKGILEGVDVSTRTFRIGPFTFVVNDETDFDDSEDDEKSYDLDQLQLGWRIECEVRVLSHLRLEAVEVLVEKEPRKTLLEIEAFVEEESVGEDGVPLLVILGVPCRIVPETQLPGGIFRKTARRIVDSDDVRPQGQLELLDGKITVGGEFQMEPELRRNFDLDSTVPGDRSVTENSFTLELTFNFDRSSYGFLKGNGSSTHLRLNEDSGLTPFKDSELVEGYYYERDIKNLPIAVQVGRQRFEEGREWFYDSNLDAIRLYYELGEFELEYSWSTILFDAPPEVVDLRNQIFVGRWRHARKSHLALYIIDILDPRAVPEAPFFVGLQAIGRYQRQFKYWLDFAYVDGVSAYETIEAHGFDVGAAYQWLEAPLKPYAYGGWAFGSGDDDLTDGVDETFRQTGYHDNNDKFFGVTSFRYYGEMFRPELSNLSIVTIGTGIRPVPWASMDLLFHRYNQVEPSPTIRDSRLRVAPDGIHDDIGTEWDLVLGLEKLRDRWDVEVVIGYFIPGSAFGPAADPSLWAVMQLEYNF